MKDSQRRLLQQLSKSSGQSQNWPFEHDRHFDSHVSRIPIRRYSNSEPWKFSFLCQLANVWCFLFQPTDLWRLLDALGPHWPQLHRMGSQGVSLAMEQYRNQSLLQLLEPWLVACFGCLIVVVVVIAEIYIKFIETNSNCSHSIQFAQQVNWLARQAGKQASKLASWMDGWMNR